MEGLGLERQLLWWWLLTGRQHGPALCRRRRSNAERRVGGRASAAVQRKRAESGLSRRAGREMARLEQTGLGGLDCQCIPFSSSSLCSATWWQQAGSRALLGKPMSGGGTSAERSRWRPPLLGRRSFAGKAATAICLTGTHISTSLTSREAEGLGKRSQSGPTVSAVCWRCAGPTLPSSARGHGAWQPGRAWAMDRSRLNFRESRVVSRLPRHAFPTLNRVLQGCRAPGVRGCCQGGPVQAEGDCAAATAGAALSNSTEGRSKRWPRCHLCCPDGAGPAQRRGAAR